MVAFLGPAVLLLHERGHARVLVVPDGGVHILDEILRPLAGLGELRVETVVLREGGGTYLRMRLLSAARIRILSIE